MKNKAHEVGGNGKCKTEKKWNVLGMGQSARLEISKWTHQEERAVDRQNNTTVPGDTAERCSVGEIKTYC